MDSYYYSKTNDLVFSFFFLRTEIAHFGRYKPVGNLSG